MNNIRNFCIIAHIDHGKSTLADRMLELTGTVELRDMKEQLLDSMELERERGITIKLQPVTMRWGDCTLNLIDTPGHVDFSYEVSRSLAACEGAVLVVDATQGIQAQTLANVYLAIEAGLTIIPVINKIDLPAADRAKVTQEIIHLLGCSKDDIVAISAKTGENVTKILDQIVSRVPAPSGDDDGELRALVFDSIYDEYRGVILYVRIVDGSLSKDQTIYMLATKASGLALEVGIFSPQKVATNTLSTGAIGYIITNFKSIEQAQVGDTVVARQSQASALPGYEKVKPYVYAGVFTTSGEDYPKLKEALAKLKLNDAALEFSIENSSVLGFGFRLGFLGMLHMEVVRARLEREFNLSLVMTNPSVDYEVELTTGNTITVQSAAQLPDVSTISLIKEPWISGEIVVPDSYLGNVMNLVISIRGKQSSLKYLEAHSVLLGFRAPLANVLTDFYDNLKSITAGYGSLSYEIDGYEAHDLVKLDFLVAGERLDSLSLIVHRTEAVSLAHKILDRLKNIIPRQLFEVSLQAAIGGRILARENIRAQGKNVTAKLYGGDVSRKHKLLDKQKKGKARMKKVGKVDIPAEAFMVLVAKE